MNSSKEGSKGEVTVITFFSIFDILRKGHTDKADDEEHTRLVYLYVNTSNPRNPYVMN